MSPTSAARELSIEVLGVLRCDIETSGLSADFLERCVGDGET